MGTADKPSASFDDLLRLARLGEQTALNALFLRAMPRLRGAAKARSRVGRAAGAGASDLLQEAVVRALGKLATFDGTTEAEWHAWLDRILDRGAIQSVRRAHSKKRKIPGGLPLDSPEAEAARSPGASPSREASRREEWQLLLASLYALPEDQREAIRLHHLEGLSVEQAAAKMGKTPVSVKGLVRRGIQAVQARVVEPDERMLLERLKAVRPAR